MSRPVVRPNLCFLGLLLLALGCDTRGGPTLAGEMDLFAADVVAGLDLIDGPELLRDTVASPQDLVAPPEDLGSPPDLHGETAATPDLVEETTPPEPDGEDCARALPIEAMDQLLTGSLLGRSDDHNSSCRLRSGAELVYTFEVSEETRFSAMMLGLDSVLSLRSACAGASEMACDDDGGAGETAWLREIRLEPGRYYLFADSHPDGEDDFELALTFEGSLCAPESCPEGMLCRTNAEWSDVECRCPEGTLAWEEGCVDDPCAPNPCVLEEGRSACTPALPADFVCACATPYYIEQEGLCAALDPLVGDTCAEAFPLTPGAEPIVRPVGLPSLSHDARSRGCGGKGPEAVFALTLAAPAFLEAQAWGGDTVLYVRRDCEDADSQPARGCNDDATPPGDHGSHLRLALPEAGTWYLFVDSYAEEAEQDAILSLFVRPDPCADGGGCRPDQLCTPDELWTAPVCACPAGTLSFEDACVDDPCEPWPCTEGDRTWCERQLPDAYACTCRPGYRGALDGACEEDPEAAAWTVLVYLNADNNLEDFGLDDVHQEMVAVGSTETVHVVVELDIASGEAERLYIQPGEAVAVGGPLGEINMGDWRQLADFGEWALANYPARRYALVMWDHGSGWHKSATAAPDEGWKSFSTDDSHPGWSISIAQGDYANAMQRIVKANGGQPLDLVAFDACLMGMWEVAHATAPFARTFVASEANIPGTGFPYHDILAPLVANPAMGPELLGAWMVQAYEEERAANATLSAVDLSLVGGVDDALSALAEALLANPALYPEIRTWGPELPWYTIRFTDLRRFAELVAALDGAPGELQTAATAVVEAVDAAVLSNGTNGEAHEHSHGLSIYLTAENYDVRYDAAPWSAATSWDEFLRDFSGVETAGR